MKKFLSLFLALLMIASVAVMGLSFTVSAEEAAPETVTPIKNAADFIKIFSGKTVEGGYYKLTASIDLTGTDYVSCASFSGTLDGDNNTVTTDTTLFTTLAGTVKNLTVEGDVTIDCDFQGAIAYKATDGVSFDSVTCKANVTYDPEVTLNDTNHDAQSQATRLYIYIGGFVGFIESDGKAEFKNCSYTGEMNITYPSNVFAGGFVGEFINCTNAVIDGFTMSGSVKLTDTGSPCVGGIAGQFKNSTVTANACAIDGSITTNSPTNAGYIGGIAGRTVTSTASVINACTVTAAITLSNTAKNFMLGGIIGQAGANGADNLAIQNCSVSADLTADVTGGDQRVGGIVGYYNVQTSSTSSIDACAFNGTITVIGASKGHIAGLVGMAYNGAFITLANSVMAAEAIESNIGYSAVIDRVHSKTFAISNCIVLSDSTGMNKGTQNGTATFTDCYGPSDINTVGNPITIGDVTYQKYNFGYLNETTKQLVTDAQELSATVEDKILGYIQLRDNGDTHDVRVIFVINAETVITKDSTVTITFTKGDETVKTFTATLGGEDSDFEVFRAGIAAGTPFFAAENCEMFGAIVNDIPDGEWDTVTAAIVSEEEIVFTGNANYAE